MQRYLISFDDGAMIIPGADFAAVSDASHQVVREAKAAGVWIWGGGILSQRASIVSPDGSVTDGPYPETKAVLGGFSILEVPSREDALLWAGKIAAACRCNQEVREIGYDQESYRDFWLKSHLTATGKKPMASASIYPSDHSCAQPVSHACIALSQFDRRQAGMPAYVALCQPHAYPTLRIFPTLSSAIWKSCPMLATLSFVILSPQAKNLVGCRLQRT